MNHQSQFIRRILDGEEVSDIGQFSKETLRELAQLVRSGLVMKILKQGPYPRPKTVYVGLAGRSPNTIEKLVSFHRRLARLEIMYANRLTVAT